MAAELFDVFQECLRSADKEVEAIMYLSCQTCCLHIRGLSVLLTYSTASSVLT